MSYFKLLSGRIEKSTREAAAFDLFCTADTIVQPGIVNLVPTGVVTEFSSDLRAIVKGKSGLASKWGLQILGGVIDADYRGEWKVICTSLKELHLKSGDRVAQFVLEVIPFVVMEGDGIIIADSVRQGGFGSTGK